MSSKDEPPSCASLFPEMVKSNESQSRSSNTETISRKEKKKQKKKEKKKKERKEKKSREKKEEKKKKRKKKATLEEWSEATEFEENKYDQSYADHFVDFTLTRRYRFMVTIMMYLQSFTRLITDSVKFH
jgi:flagellar biosynthesis GTPase FlhF